MCFEQSPKKSPVNPELIEDDELDLALQPTFDEELEILATLRLMSLDQMREEIKDYGHLALIEIYADAIVGEKLDLLGHDFNKLLKLESMIRGIEEFDVHYIRNDSYTLKYCMMRSPERFSEIFPVNTKDLTNIRIAIDAIKTYYANDMLFYITDDLKKEYCLESLEESIYNLNYIPKELSRDPEFAKTVDYFIVNLDGVNLEHIPDKRKILDLCTIAVSKNPKAMKFVPANVLTEELCLIGVKKDGRVLKYIPIKFQTDIVCIEAIMQNYKSIMYLHLFKANTVLYDLAFSINTDAIYYMKKLSIRTAYLEKVLLANPMELIRIIRTKICNAESIELLCDHTLKTHPTFISELYEYHPELVTLDRCLYLYVNHTYINANVRLENHIPKHILDQVLEILKSFIL